MIILEQFMKIESENIIHLANDFNLSHRYISVFIRLHLPYYSADMIENTPNYVFLDLKNKLSNKLNSFSTFYNKTICNVSKFDKSQSKIKGKSQLICSIANKEDIKITFEKVNEKIGKFIQEEFHYIGKFRKDTLNHFGLFASDDSIPFCYASISELDRDYILKALKSIGLNIKKNEILVMTRAFGFDSIPHNSMSKLFDRIASYYKNSTYKIIVTALNPLLGFKGSIFYGSSYFKFATSPMKYYYDENGIYLNRKSAIKSQNIHIQKLKTPNIFWLARGLTRKISHYLENNEIIYNIKSKEYENG